MSELLIFSDASVDSKLQTGFGAYLAVVGTRPDIIDGMADAGPRADVVADIPHSNLKIKRFTATTPSQLEIKTVLWALQEVMLQSSAVANNIILFTDSQSIIELPRRRTKLEQTGFRGASTGHILKHADLYRAFYRLQDQLAFKLVKLKGHRKSADKTPLDRVFAQVDRAARKALREYRRHGGAASPID
jgi:ribonuclease HI